jgi:hypothetical protein
VKKNSWWKPNMVILHLSLFITTTQTPHSEWPARMTADLHETMQQQLLTFGVRFTTQDLPLAPR